LSVGVYLPVTDFLRMIIMPPP